MLQHPFSLGAGKVLECQGLTCHFVDSCASRGESAAILFLDLKAAYYSVVKEMYSSVGNSSCERFLAALFRRLQLPEEALDDFVQLVSTTCLLDDANIGTTLQAMVRSTLEQSRYQIPNSPDVYAPSTGSRPGDPLADVLFSYAMADVLTEVYNMLAGSPDILQVPPDYPAGTTWADDTCVFISGDPNTLEHRTGVVYSIVHEAMTKRGLTLALGPYKTAVIMAFRGPNGKRLHRNLFTRQHPKVISCLEYGAAASLEVQFVYKHLGSLVDVTGSLLPEGRFRMVASSCGQHRCDQGLGGVDRAPSHFSDADHICQWLTSCLESGTAYQQAFPTTACWPQMGRWHPASHFEGWRLAHTHP